MPIDRCAARAGFDVPDMLAAGPRDVLVAGLGREAAREVLLQADLRRPRPARPGGRRPARLLVGLLRVVALVADRRWLGSADRLS